MDTSEELIKVIRGRPFDSEGGGGLANLVGTGSPPENLFPGIPRPDYLFSFAKKKKKPRGG